MIILYKTHAVSGAPLLSIRTAIAVAFLAEPYVYDMTHPVTSVTDNIYIWSTTYINTLCVHVVQFFVFVLFTVFSLQQALEWAQSAFYSKPHEE